MALGVSIWPGGLFTHVLQEHDMENYQESMGLIVWLII